MIHRLLFSAKNIVAKSSIAFLLAILLASVVAVPAFATDGVLNTSGYADGYYYECTYTPIDYKHGHYHDKHHGKHYYTVDGYKVECKYTDIDDHYGKKHHGHHDHHGHHGHHGHHHHKKCYYTVQLGDNLSSVAARYGVSFTKLAHMNNLPYPYYLYVGNVLRVPCHY